MESDLMKAMVLRAFGKPLVWEEVPDPKPGPEEVLIESHANGLCATDLTVVDGLLKTARPPLLLGHECAGIVREVGTEVRDLKPGDPVVLVTRKSCGRCDACRRGHEEWCSRSPGRFGMELNAGFGELAVFPERNLVRVGPNVPLDGASLIAGTMASPLHGIHMAEIKMGDTAVIFGMGGLGLHVLQILRHLGAEVIGVDVSPEKLEKSLELGASAVVNAAESDPVEAVMDITNGRGADAALEIVAGEAVPIVLAQCVESLCKGGRLLILGYHHGQTFSVDPMKVVHKFLKIIGSHTHTAKDVADIATLMNDGRLQAVISDRMPMREANEGLEKLRTGDPIGRIVLEW